MDDIKEALKEEFSHLHPLVFQRSVERANSDGELFDILSTVPEPPFVWKEESRKWEQVDSLMQKEKEFK